MFDEDKEKTVWKTYPEYPWIQANQFGEIRTVDRTVTGKDGKKYHIKGRVLKQHDNGRGYMRVHLSVNGKKIKLYVHRIMAASFLPNPNNYPEVNHKDNDRTNNRLDNLEWCTHEYNETYKKNFGTSQAQLFGRPVFAVDLNTGKVLRFKTQREASRQLGIRAYLINNVIKGRCNTAGGCWFTEDESEITEKRIQEIKDNMLFLGGVIAINTETSEVFRFKTQSEAARQLDVGKGNIYSVLKCKRRKAGGCWFCYADEHAVEKTRKKFGDEIAGKVKELMNIL